MTERIVERQCVRPGCTRPAVATLAFRYDTRQAWLSALTPAPVPATYDLCSVCAGRTNPPRGWYLVDERPVSEPAAAPADEATVAVLAAALAGAPDAAAGEVTDPAAQAAVDGPAIDDTELVASPSQAARSPERVQSDAPEHDADDRPSGGLRSVPTGGPVVRSTPFAPSAPERAGVRPVMAALLGEAEGPLVSLSAVDDVTPHDPGPPEPVQPEAPAASSSLATSTGATADPAATVAAADAGASHREDGPDAPRLFTVPSHHTPRGTASVW